MLILKINFLKNIFIYFQIKNTERIAIATEQR
jgi:hypothetical protein